MPPTRAMFAEFVGTFALMFVGGGAIILTAAYPEGTGGLLTVALAHGLILAVMVSATMHISGGQINPAVSIALAACGKQPWNQAGIFIIAQILGSVCAAMLLWTLLRDLTAAGQDQPAVEFVRIGATLGLFQSEAIVFALEVIATFFLMFVIMGTVVDGRGVGKTAAVGGFGIGLVVAADIICFGPLTGASMNPARSLGPQLVGMMTGVEGTMQMAWVYWVAPVVGALIAIFSYQGFFGGSTDEKS